LGPAGCMVQSAAVALSIGAQLGLYLGVLFVICMVCHGELARSRPAPRYLTSFYLAIAAGGAVGGVFVALVAPRVFTEFSEYPAGLAAACLLGFAGWARSGALAQWTSRNFAVRIPLMALLVGGTTAIVATVTSGAQAAVASKRNFYGILRVTQRTDKSGPWRTLRHGHVVHGTQFLQDPQRTTTYYGPHSGVALAFNALERPRRRVAIVGLGAGTMAAWGRAGDTFRFYEINPDVEAMARDWFTFLKDSRARTEVVLGDARVQLESELDRGLSEDFDMIAVDAFSGDTIPVHLLTAECARIYRRRLAPGGLLLLHISNRVLNLQPVAQGLAQSLGWKAALFGSLADGDTGESAADWVLATADS
ncbi:MAG TPA: fused MFS/spermidine synthase, partial [Ktedonobacterales bacterium]|nr:fused MFS/spermidine synthase [Ktedonobacterales bacterium]